MQHATMAPSMTRDEAARSKAASCETCAASTTGVCQPCSAKLTEEVVAADKDTDIKLARLAAVKRQIGTPTESPVQEPPNGRAKGEDGLPVLPKFPVPASGSEPQVVDSILAAIAALSTKIDGMSLKQDNMVSKQDLQVMQNQMESKTQVMVSSAVDPLKDTIFDLQARLEKVEQTGPVGSNQNASSSTHGQELLQNQINALQAKIVELSFQKRPVAVIGGFRNCGNLEDAKVWINAKCVEYGVASAVDIWCPKAGFKGIAFAKFADTSTRDKFVSKVQSTKPQYESIPVWSRAEAPVEVRACEKSLSGLKKLLVGWGFDPSRIHYDTESAEKTLKVDNATKVTVCVREGTLHCEWEQSFFSIQTSSHL